MNHWYQYSILGEDLKNKLSKRDSVRHKGKISGCNMVKPLEMGKSTLSGTKGTGPELCCSEQHL